MRYLHLVFFTTLGLVLISLAHADSDAAEARFIYEHIKLERDLALTLADRQPQSFWQTQAQSSQRKLIQTRLLFEEHQLPHSPDYAIGVFQHDEVARLYQRLLQQAGQNEPIKTHTELLAKTLDRITQSSLNDALATVTCLTRKDLHLLLNSEQRFDRNAVEANLPDSIKRAMVGTEPESCQPAGVNQIEQNAGLLSQPPSKETFAIPATLTIH